MTDELLISQGGSPVSGQTVIIISGEGDGQGTIERYVGARTKHALRSRLSRERCGGARWAYAWIAVGEFDTPNHISGVSAWPVFARLGADLAPDGQQRLINPAAIRDNPAAQLAAGHKRPASAENGRKGGRPKTQG